ncbi:MAG: hypothetical protein QXP47_00520 [Candidatus Nezhaarchaeales archaeon]|nr:MAG: hypothetical protein DSO06_06280 [Candidatus Nezhaarchaeota archaeon WYZ-LMO8]TDA35490.1 MAG: hypothetical protein DSO05_05215 [Candidatus Nezhaarchaeota archaeon WYZ-LMO7]
MSILENLPLIFSQPQVLAAVAVQFLLGLALGYVSVKALKYILAFIAILVLGTFLSVWSLGLTPAQALQTIGTALQAVKELAVVLGLMSIGPVSIGFVVGAIIGLMKK